MTAKIALVTGSGSGIGRAAALCLLNAASKQWQAGQQAYLSAAPEHCVLLEAG